MEYEDINDYLKAIQKSIPQAYSITEFPFGIECKGSDGNIYAYVKQTSNQIQIMCAMSKKQ